MSLKSIYYSIFKRELYDSILSYYTKFENSAEIVRNEFLKKYSNGEDVGSFGFKESVYNNKLSLEKLIKTHDDYIKIGTHYKRGLKLYKEEKGFTRIDFAKETQIVSNQKVIVDYDNCEREFNRIKKNFRKGFESYVRENGLSQETGISFIKRIIEQETIISEWHGYIKEYQAIKKDFPKGLNIYLEGKNFRDDSFSDLKNIVDNKAIIADYDQCERIFLDIKKNFKKGIDSYISENRFSDINISIKKEIIAAKNDIVDRDNIFTAYEHLIKDYKQGVLLFLSENGLNPCLYSDVKNIVDNKSSVIEYNQYAQDYKHIQDEYPKGLENYIREVELPESDSLLFKKLIVNASAEIAEREKQICEYELLLKDYKDGVALYAQENKLDKGTYSDIKEIVLHKSIVIEYNQYDQEFRKIQGNYTKGLDSYIRETELPDSEGILFRKLIVGAISEIVSRHENIIKYESLLKDHRDGVSLYIQVNKLDQGAYSCISKVVRNKSTVLEYEQYEQKILQLRTDYPKGYDNYIKETELPDSSSFFYKKSIVKASDEIVKRDTIINEYEKLYRNYKKGVSYWIYQHPQLIDLKYNDLSNIIENSDKVRKLNRWIVSIVSNKKVFPELYSEILSYYSGCKTDVSEQNDSWRVLNEKSLETIFVSLENWEVSEKYRILASKYNDETKKIIFGTDSIPSVGDVSDDAIRLKQLFISVEKQLFPHIKIKPQEKKVFSCDIEDKAIKVRCILKSELYGSKVRFVDTYTILDFYSFAEKIFGYDMTFDEITEFRTKNTEAVKSYNLINSGKSTFYIEDYFLIGGHDPKLFEHISNKNSEKNRILSLQNKLKEIKSKYPDGYRQRTDEINYDESSSDEKKLQSLLDDQSIIIRYDEIKRAKTVVSKFPEASLELYGIREHTSMSHAQAQTVLSNKYEIERKQREINDRKALERKKEKYMSCVSDWYRHRFSTIPHKWQCDYYKYEDNKADATQEMRDTWNYIYPFKNDPKRNINPVHHQRALEKAVYWVTETLKTTFGSYVSELTLVCLTASTKENNDRRFKIFAERVCSNLNMRNAYSHINIISDGEAKHYGGKVKATKSYDRSWFEGKFIVLFDDVRTSGGSMNEEKRVLESMGATVICAITLAQTCSRVR